MDGKVLLYRTFHLPIYLLTIAAGMAWYWQHEEGGGLPAMREP